jgi:hypothetical protein
VVTGLALCRFAGDADLLPFRAAGDAEKQHAFRDVRFGAASALCLPSGLGSLRILKSMRRATNRRASAARSASLPVPSCPRRCSAAAGTDHESAERRDRDVIGPLVRAHDRLVATTEAGHGERPCAVLTHVAERHQRAELMARAAYRSWQESRPDPWQANCSRGVGDGLELGLL